MGDILRISGGTPRRPFGRLPGGTRRGAIAVSVYQADKVEPGEAPFPTCETLRRIAALAAAFV
jgi:hypothetical protein